MDGQAFGRIARRIIRAGKFERPRNQPAGSQHGRLSAAFLRAPPHAPSLPLRRESMRYSISLHRERSAIESSRGSRPSSRGRPCLHPLDESRLGACPLFASRFDPSTIANIHDALRLRREPALRPSRITVATGRGHGRRSSAPRRHPTWASPWRWDRRPRRTRLCRPACRRRFARP